MGDAVGPPGAVDAQMFPILDKGRIADADVLPGRLLRCSPPGQACKGKEWCKDVLVAVTQLQVDSAFTGCRPKISNK